MKKVNPAWKIWVLANDVIHKELDDLNPFSGKAIELRKKHMEHVKSAPPTHIEEG